VFAPLTRALDSMATDAKQDPYDLLFNSS